MATAVTTGTVALMLDAAGKNRQFLTPNLVKAILQWSAIPAPGYDVLTQGTGAINASGALSLTRQIDPRAPVGTYWLTSSVVPATTIAGLVWPWAQTVIWGSTIGYGAPLDTNQTAWGQTVIWGTTVVWGNTVVWGHNVVWSDPSVWSSTVVWGNTAIGTTDGATVVWGNALVNSSTVVWGNLVIVSLGSGSEALTIAEP
jgi:hypothetical protein